MMCAASRHGRCSVGPDRDVEGVRVGNGLAGEGSTICCAITVATREVIQPPGCLFAAADVSGQSANIPGIPSAFQSGKSDEGSRYDGKAQVSAHRMSSGDPINRSAVAWSSAGGDGPRRSPWHSGTPSLCRP